MTVCNAGNQHAHIRDSGATNSTQSHASLPFNLIISNSNSSTCLTLLLQISARLLQWNAQSEHSEQGDICTIIGNVVKRKWLVGRLPHTHAG